MRRGSVHWALLDKRRPCVVVSPEVRNLHASDVVVVPCSSSTRPMRWHVPLRKGEAGLPAASFAKCEQVTTLPKADVEPRRIGELSPARMRELEAALLSALGIDSTP